MVSLGSTSRVIVLPVRVFTKICMVTSNCVRFSRAVNDNAVYMSYRFQQCIMKNPAKLVCVSALLWVDTANGSISNVVQSAVKSMDYRYFVAGGTCAAISHGITTPIDVVKTKIQADPKKYGGGMQQATVSIVKEEGINALLGGLGPTLVGYGIEGVYKLLRINTRRWLNHCLSSVLRRYEIWRI